MATDQFPDAALVLVGHGSLTSAAAAAPVQALADAFRARGGFAQVLESYWKQEPGLAGVLRGVAVARAFVVPVFLAEGYFTEQVIPRELGLTTDDVGAGNHRFEIAGRRLHYCRPVGTHANMAEVILARAREIIAAHPFPRAPKPGATALIVVGHGTGEHDNSRRAVEDHVHALRPRDVFGEVHAVFLEEEPRVDACFNVTALPNLVIVPFLIGEGLHSSESIPLLLGEPEPQLRRRLAAGRPPWRNPTERHGKRVWYASPVGSHPRILHVVLDRVREAAAA